MWHHWPGQFPAQFHQVNVLCQILGCWLPVELCTFWPKWYFWSNYLVNMIIVFFVLCEHTYCSGEYLLEYLEMVGSRCASPCHSHWHKQGPGTCWYTSHQSMPITTIYPYNTPTMSTEPQILLHALRPLPCKWIDCSAVLSSWTLLRKVAQSFIKKPAL